MSELKEATAAYKEALCKTPEYREYCRTKESAKQDPKLWEEIMNYRLRVHEFQTSHGSDELFDRTASFEQEFAEWKKDKRVTEFLDAELALCRLIQEAFIAVVDDIGFE